MLSTLAFIVLTAQPASTPAYSYKVEKTYPHDPNAFKQGLSFLDGFLYEGIGLNGRSGLRKVNLESGKVLQQKPIEEQYFGEGGCRSRGRAASGLSTIARRFNARSSSSTAAKVGARRMTRSG